MYISATRLRTIVVTALATILLTGVLTTRKAQADFYTVNFDYSRSGNLLASGVFTYDAALDGSALSYGDLSTFNLSILGQNYDLNYVKSGNFSPYYYFTFDSSTDLFIPTNVEGAAMQIAALRNDSSGFFLGDYTNGNTAVTAYAPFTQDNYNSQSITKSLTVVVPEASTATFIGLALPLVGMVAARVIRRKK